MKNTTIGLSIVTVIVMLASSPLIAQEGHKIEAPGGGLTAPRQVSPGAFVIRETTNQAEVEGIKRILGTQGRGAVFNYNSILELLKQFRPEGSEGQGQCCLTDCDYNINRCATCCASPCPTACL